MMVKLENLPIDVIQQILTKVEFSQILNECRLVCSVWNSIIKNKRFILEYIQENVINYPNFRSREITPDEMNLFKIITSPYVPSNIVLNTYEASSFDHFSQHHLMTISDDVSVFWSSKGTSESCDEYITYGISTDIAIIREICFRFFLSQWILKDGSPVCFSSQSIRIDILDENSRIIYSQPFQTQHSNSVQRFTFDKPIFVTNSCRIKLNLIGKREKQDQLYYSCIKFFKVFGDKDIWLSHDFDGNKITKKSFQDIISSIRKLKINIHRINGSAYHCFIHRSNAREERVEAIINMLNKLGRGEIYNYFLFLRNSISFCIVIMTSSNLFIFEFPLTIIGVL